MDEKNLENAFNRLCADTGIKKSRDLWPQVRQRTAAAGAIWPSRRAAWVLAASAAAFVVILSIPGVSQSIMTRLARLFSSNYSVRVGGAEYKGVLVSVEGETRELRAGDRYVQVKVTSAGERAVKVELLVYSRDRKLLAKPSLVSVTGKALEIKISGGDGAEDFMFRMVPAEKQPGSYSASVYQLPDAVLNATDAIQRETLDTTAMYWAWRISVMHDVTYEQFEKYAFAWDLLPATRDLLLERIRALVASGKARRLDQREENILKDTEARLDALITSTPRMTADFKRRITASDEALRPVAKIEAMYWAWRIAEKKDVTYEELLKLSANWFSAEETKAALFRNIKAILDSGKARPLTAPEQARYEKALFKAREAGKHK